MCTWKARCYKATSRWLAKENGLLKGWNIPIMLHMSSLILIKLVQSDKFLRLIPKLLRCKCVVPLRSGNLFLAFRFRSSFPIDYDWLPSHLANEADFCSRSSGAICPLRPKMALFPDCLRPPEYPGCLRIWQILLEKSWRAFYWTGTLLVEVLLCCESRQM